MEKKTRLMVLGGVGALVLLVGLYMLWPSSGTANRVDPAIVEAAAESSRQAQKQQAPTEIEEPKREGRARPGMMGSGN